MQATGAKGVVLVIVIGIMRCGFYAYLFLVAEM